MSMAVSSDGERRESYGGRGRRSGGGLGAPVKRTPETPFERHHIVESEVTVGVARDPERKRRRLLRPEYSTHHSGCSFIYHHESASGTSANRRRKSSIRACCRCISCQTVGCALVSKPSLRGLNSDSGDPAVRRTRYSYSRAR